MRLSSAETALFFAHERRFLRHTSHDHSYPRFCISSVTVRFVSMPHVAHTYRMSTRRTVTKVRSCASMGR